MELDLDITGKVAGLENSEFTNSRQMGEILASSAQCQECVVRQVFRYMAGRRDTPADAPLIRGVLDDFRRSGFQFQQLLVSLVKARERSGPEEGVPMANTITKRTRLSRRLFLKGLSAAQSSVVVGLPPLVSMFNSHGTAYAASRRRKPPIEKRFVLWFNGNGIPERYWIPDNTGADYDMTPCLSPLARLRNDVHVISGLDNSAIVNTAFDGHSTAMSALMTCTRYSGRGPNGPSLDQIVARRFRSENRVPFAADRRVAGVLRRRDAEEHELGRTRPRAAARRNSAPPVRSRIRRQGRRLGAPETKRPRFGAGGGQRLRAGLPKEDSRPARRAPFLRARRRARRSLLCRPSIRTCRSRARTSI